MIKGFDAIVDSGCTVLILGSFPSVISREQSFYYANPQNKFWKIIGELFVGKDMRKESAEVKTKLILQHNIALWDIVESCDIKGSSDNKISNFKVVNLERIFEIANIKKIFFNGKKSAEIYSKNYTLNIPTVILPSTSPANASANKTIFDVYKANLLTF